MNNKLLNQKDQIIVIDKMTLFYIELFSLIPITMCGVAECMWQHIGARGLYRLSSYFSEIESIFLIHIQL